ncbi:MAG: NPCBM/NEW2 domain-containing protein, partial [Chthoniobacteraceae bacterium]
AAFDALPEWEQQLLAAQRGKLIEFDCMIPDLVRAPANRKTLGRFGTLPNGDPFTHEPHSRHHNFSQMLHYFTQAVEQVRAGDLDEASRYAGCLLHFLEDCGSPAHSIPGDNQHGLMKDLLVVPEVYKDRPLHGLIEGGTLKIDLAGYHPRLLGTTPQEAVAHLIERLNFAVRNARSQVIPILQGVFADQQDAIDAGRRRAATVDAQVSADALHTIFSIAKNRLEETEKAALKKVDLGDLTPLEVISQAYFPQNTYFSNPFFGYPTPDGILKDGTDRQPLVLRVMENGAAIEKPFARGFGVGTHTRLSYSLPEKVYDRFECTIGLHPTLGVTGSVAFRIYADGEAVFDSGVLTGQDAARIVSIPVWRVAELSIDIEGRGPQTPASNYAVIGSPVLFKANGPPALDQEKVR